jgi:hypothetical protein
MYEAGRLQLRADFFNAFNHTQFVLGGMNVNDKNGYGVMGSARGARTIQLSLRFAF